jgi:hypothetical protein
LLFGRTTVSRWCLRGALLVAIASEPRPVAAISTAIATLEAVSSEPPTTARPAIPIAATTVAWLTAAFSEGEQCKVPGALDRRRQRALMFGTGAGLAARLDHPTVGDEAAHAWNVLVIDVLDAVDTEAAHLATRKRAATAATAAKPTRGTGAAVATRLFVSFFSHSTLTLQMSVMCRPANR